MTSFLEKVSRARTVPELRKLLHEMESESERWGSCKPGSLDKSHGLLCVNFEEARWHASNLAAHRDFNVGMGLSGSKFYPSAFLVSALWLCFGLWIGQTWLVALSITAMALVLTEWLHSRVMVRNAARWIAREEERTFEGWRRWAAEISPQTAVGHRGRTQPR